MIRARRLVRQQVSVARRLDTKRRDRVISLADRCNMCRRWNSSSLRMGYLLGMRGLRWGESAYCPPKPVMSDATTLERVCVQTPFSTRLTQHRHFRFDTTA